MSTTYKVIAGDTFEIIARKLYGTQTQAGRIATANPGVFEPLTSGIVLFIPNLPGAPENLPIATDSDTENEVAIILDRQRFRYWDRVTILRSIDSMDTVHFEAPFQSDIPGFKNIFRPFSYKSMEITVGGNPFFTGTMVTPIPVLENNRRVVGVDGYSLPGVLNDCTLPASSFPLEFDNQGLQEIAATIAAPFGIDVDFRAEQGAVFQRVAVKSTEKVIEFLSKLAKQRNLIISSTPRGKLLFWQSVEVGNPIARLRQGESPILSVEPSFKAQQYYSHVTGVESVTVGTSGSQFTVQNERLQGVIRPLNFEVQDTINADVKAAVESKTGRMFGNAVSYIVNVNTWRDSFGNLWEPNTTVTLIAPDAMIYNEYEFIIRSVTFNADPLINEASLLLVMPGAFNGQIPDILPWD